MDLDTRTGLTLPKRIKEAQEKQYNYIIVVGEKEQKEDSVNVRTRDGVIHGMKSVEQLRDEWKDLVTNYK